jgi:hypothetical protein
VASLKKRRNSNALPFLTIKTMIALVYRLQQGTFFHIYPSVDRLLLFVSPIELDAQQLRETPWHSGKLIALRLS